MEPRRNRIAVVGIGNRLQGDDAAGLVVAEGLQKKLTGKPNVRVFQVGETPENHLGEIASFTPEVIYLVDAGHFGAEPGAWRLFPASEIRSQGFTTHAASLSLTASFLEEQTGASIFLLAIQPDKIQVGAEKLSEKVGKEIDRVIDYLVELCGGA
jgi:hydrogenase 3 maturation protease